MIAVIADDLTGAAELAGVGKTYGLNVELAIGLASLSIHKPPTVDLLVVATDARSVSEMAAVEEMIQVSRAIKALKPKLIYKKTDSVLRGHVLAETQAQMQVFGLFKALLLPANPALGRTLVNGQYYVQNIPIHQTHFVRDPEFPITESDIVKRFAGKAAKLVVQPHQVRRPDQGIVIGEVGNEADLISWTNQIDGDTLLGGGSGFFSALLDARQLRKQKVVETAQLGDVRLYACGTAFGESVTLVRKAAAMGYNVYYMPESLTRATSQEADVAHWAQEVADGLRRHKQGIIAIDPASVEDRAGLAVHLRTIMAEAVGNILTNVLVDELIIEGGATAAALLQEIGVTRLEVTQELAAGVVRSKALERATLHITMKPGSYRWPPDLWTF